MKKSTSETMSINIACVKCGSNNEISQLELSTLLPNKAYLCPDCRAKTLSSKRDPEMSRSYYQIGEIELVDLIRELPYNRGAAIKYIVRAGVKDKETEREDLRKALWHVTNEIARLSGLKTREEK